MEIGRHRGIVANERITIGSSSYEKEKSFKYLGSLLSNLNDIHEEIKFRLEAGNSYYNSIQTLLTSRLLSKNFKFKILLFIQSNGEYVNIIYIHSSVL